MVPFTRSAAAAPRIMATRDGTHAVILESGRATVVRIADRETVCEQTLPAGAEVAWIHALLRLLVVAPTEAATEVRLINPIGNESVRRVAEIRLEGAMHLGAATGQHALLLGARTAAVLSGGEFTITPYQFLARTLPQIVGVAGSQFVVALPGTIEEWDPASRMPKRRLRLPRVATITSLGGSDRVLWMTTQQEPARLDVLPLVNRGQPKAHELPEPIAVVSGHPQTDAVICIGAETGRIYAIDLDGKTRLRTIALPGIDRAEAAALVVHGTALSVIAAQAGRPIAVAALEGVRETEAAPALPPIQRAPSTPIHLDRAPASTLYEESPPSSPGDSPARPRTVAEALRRTPSADPPPSSIEEARRDALPEVQPRSIAEALRRRADENRGRAPVSSADENRGPAPVSSADENRGRAPVSDPDESPVVEVEPPKPTAWSEGASELIAKLASLRTQRDASPDAPQRVTWRDDAGAWARAVASGTFDRAAPSCPPIETLAERFELPAQLVPALVLLYGSHLAGMQGAAPMDVARVLGRRWDDALGRGKLAELGLATYAESRVRLATPILRVLDELPHGGELIGEPGPVGLLGPAVLVSREPIRVLGVRVVAQLGGAILLGSYVDAVALALEARALGAIAMGHVDLAIIPHHPILIVVADESAAEQIDLPRFEISPAIDHQAT